MGNDESLPTVPVFQDQWELGGARTGPRIQACPEAVLHAPIRSRSQKRIQGTGISDLLLKRGWVNYAEGFLFVWGLVILLMKWRKAKFLRAIPILGFIRTVEGLSIAVSSLSTGSGDPNQLKESINELTGGLGVAFDTTLPGLVLSMILSFPLAGMQKEEDEVLTLIDAFCNEKLMPKLNDSKSDTSDMLLSQAENIRAFAASLARAHELFLVKLQDATALLAQAGETEYHGVLSR